MTDDRKKPGPDPERLKIEGDPEEALGRLLRTPRDTGREVFDCPRCGGRFPMSEVEHERQDQPELAYLCPNPDCDYRETDRERHFRLKEEDRLSGR